MPGQQLFPAAKGLGRPRDNLVRDSDRRRLRASISSLYPRMGEAALEKLIPLGRSAPEFVQCILKVPVDTGQKEEVYRVGPAREPVFFTLNGTGFLPSCYTLHIAPEILRVVRIYSGVERKICKGADLFLPGVVRPPDLAELAAEHGPKWPEHVFGGPWEKGEVCAILAEDAWAPCAVGVFAVSCSDVLQGGFERGTAVEVLHHVGDALWESGSGTMPPREPPPEVAAAAVEYAERRARERELEMERMRELDEQAIAEGYRARTEELQKSQRKLLKSLRQLEEMSIRARESGRALNEDQLLKLSRKEGLEQELESVTKDIEQLVAGEVNADDVDVMTPAEAEVLAAILELPEPEAPAVASSKYTMSHPPDYYDNSDEEEGEDRDRSESDDGEEGRIGEGEGGEERNGLSQEEVDSLFLRNFAAAAAGESLPALSSLVFSRASQMEGGLSIKSTSWKKASAFLRSFSSALTCREDRPGVVEVVRFDLNGIPASRLADGEKAAKAWAVLASKGGASVDISARTRGGPGSLRPTKKGGQVLMAVRRVRNKNVTFIENLDSWGFTKDSLGELCKILRRRFSASATVCPRPGSEGGKRQLWSIQVQGKCAEDAKALLQEMGVTSVSITKSGKK
jgi:predicted ribosome-associated RNA-binding protein Tma20/translation initiation factor 1 (eIF-1/SUI1)